MTYDPAFMNTAACRSAITFIDGDRGILRYRGYPDRAAGRAGLASSRSPTCWARASCPPRPSSSTWDETRSSTTPTSTPTSPSSSRGSATTRTPWACCWAWWARSRPSIPTPSTSTIPANRYLAARAAAGQGRRPSPPSRSATRAACRSCFPDNDLDYIGNFVNMTFSIGGRHKPNKVLQRALEILLILHADHEQNCSTSAVRAVGLVARGSVLGGQRRDRGAVRAAARRRQRGRARRCSTRSATRRTSRGSSRR